MDRWKGRKSLMQYSDHLSVETRSLYGSDEDSELENEQVVHPRYIYVIQTYQDKHDIYYIYIDTDIPR
jgi:hypothetical protein